MCYLLVDVTVSLEVAITPEWLKPHARSKRGVQTHLNINLERLNNNR